MTKHDDTKPLDPKDVENWDQLPEFIRNEIIKTLDQWQEWQITKGAR